VVEVSARRRRYIIDALRRGTVPQAGLDVLAVGLDRFAGALDEDLDRVASGGAVFKAVRGDYGSGKTFFTRHLAERALQRGFAVSEVQVSETETPLHRLETVYRRVTETLRTASIPPSAFRAVLDSWFYTLEEDALEADPSLDAADGVAVGAAVGGLVERRLASVASSAPGFALALRGYGVASLSGEAATADAVAAWLGGQPHVASAAKRAAGVRGGLDHFGAMGFLQGLLTVLRDAGHPGLLLVLDEVETLQRMRGPTREKASTPCASGSTSSTRPLPGPLPGRDGHAGLLRRPPGCPAPGAAGPAAARRLRHRPRFDNPRAVQIRLAAFDQGALLEVGRKVRDLYAEGRAGEARLRARGG
jgi:hypothetical protein